MADLFGFHALQLGLPELDALQANRMPHRWLAAQACEPEHEPQADGEATASAQAAEMQAPVTRVTRSAILRCEFEALPFPSQSLDLVVLPHALELARDPHQTLNEVERVLVPEGRVVIVGFNPASLWGLCQRAGRMKRRLAMARDKPLFLPGGDFIGYWRMRDWLRLLSFDIERGRFGCYRPPVRTQRWLDRYSWMEPAGDRWWPVFGAVYFLVAVKRVRGMRLVGLVRSERVKPATAPAVVANRHRERHEDRT